MVMQTTVSRRDFLKLTTCSLVGSALPMSTLHAVEPFKRPGPPRLRLSLAAYSFRQYFKDSNRGREAKPGAERQIDLFQFIDYCAEHGCEGTELTSYYFPNQVDPEFLLALRRHAFLRGISISGTAVGNTFTHPAGEERNKEIAHVKTWIDHARILGAPHIRVFAGNRGKDMSQAEAKRNCISALEECADYAGKAGVFLGIENHGGIVAEPSELLEIVRAVKNPWVGINLDSGNFHTDDPYRDFAACAPYAVNVQIKSEMRPSGQNQNIPADLPRLVRLLRETPYQGFVALEYEAAEDPWKAVPGLLAQLKQLMD